MINRHYTRHDEVFLYLTWFDSIYYYYLCCLNISIWHNITPIDIWQPRAEGKRGRRSVNLGGGEHCSVFLLFRGVFRLRLGGRGILRRRKQRCRRRRREGAAAELEGEGATTAAARAVGATQTGKKAAAETEGTGTAATKQNSDRRRGKKLQQNPKRERRGRARPRGCNRSNG